MKLTVLDEPLLEFSGGARHIDPRHGIADYGPADATNSGRKSSGRASSEPRRQSRDYDAG